MAPRFFEGIFVIPLGCPRGIRERGELEWTEKDTGS